MLPDVDSVVEEISVLLVDDEEDILELTETFLKKNNENFNIFTETTAQDGLDILESKEIDCIVGDYDMPGMNGLEFLSACRCRKFEASFILFTGKGSEQIASQAISGGAADYIRKGANTDIYSEIADSIEESVNQNRSEQEFRKNTWFECNKDEGFIALDSEYTIKYINELGRWILRSSLSASEGGPIVGQTLWEFFPQSEAREFKEKYDLVLETKEPAEFQSYYKPLDKQFSVRVFPVMTGIIVLFKENPEVGSTPAQGAETQKE